MQSLDYMFFLVAFDTTPSIPLGDEYGSQAVFTAPFVARSLLARLGSNFLRVAVNAKD